MPALPELLADPVTLAVALLAVALTGLSKGGLGGAFALMGVPVMALVLPPVQAAAVLLPVLLMMDAVSLWTWRGRAQGHLLRAMLPPALLGIGLGWLAAAITPDAAVKLIVGLLALGFVARQLARPRPPATGRRRASAWGWGTLSGFTSFVAHAGGPPFQMHVLPLRLDPRDYTGTSVVFFAVLNAVKVVPYVALGLFDARTLTAAGWLVPVAVVAVLAGAWLVRRMRPAVFYPFMFGMLGLVSARLIWDGIKGLV
jgi:uncharacterized protein